MGWGGCERALKLRLSRKDLTGKAKAKTGIGKSDLPGLQGGPRKRDFVLHDKVRAPRLYPDFVPPFKITDLPEALHFHVGTNRHNLESEPRPSLIIPLSSCGNKSANTATCALGV